MTAEGKRRQISFTRYAGPSGGSIASRRAATRVSPAPFEEGFGCHGFRSVGCEIIAHQFQKGVISHPLAAANPETGRLLPAPAGTGRAEWARSPEGCARSLAGHSSPRRRSLTEARGNMQPSQPRTRYRCRKPARPIPSRACRHSATVFEAECASSAFPVRPAPPSASSRFARSRRAKSRWAGRQRGNNPMDRDRRLRRNRSSCRAAIPSGWAGRSRPRPSCASPCPR